MPYGLLRFSANTSERSGLPAAFSPRKARIRPPPLSATKTSPFGATRMTRGVARPSEYRPTLKPLGAFGHALAGRLTMAGGLPAELVANGTGRSLTAILCTAPGTSDRKSVNGVGGGGAVIGVMGVAPCAVATI